MKSRIYGLTKEGYVRRQIDGPTDGGRVGEGLMHGRVDTLTDGKRWLIKGKGEHMDEGRMDEKANEWTCEQKKVRLNDNFL
jgi:hypothetical protein